MVPPLKRSPSGLKSLMITRPMIGLSLSSPLQALQVFGLPVLSLGSVRPVILPVSIPPCSESSTSEITLPLFSSIVFHGPTGTAAATARPTPNTTPSPINPQVRRIALSFRLPTGQFWKISVDCTVMAFPHQFSVWAEARSARVTLGFTPWLSLRIENPRCRSDAKCEVWVRHSPQSSEVAHPPVTRMLPPTNSAHNARVLIGLPHVKVELRYRSLDRPSVLSGAWLGL